MSKRCAVFLDLQGTLGGQGLDDVLGFSFYPCAIPAIRLLNEAGLPALVVTNQSHIARGDFTYVDFQRRIGQMQGELAKHGAHLDAVYCCPHSARDGCACRKPLPGLLLNAEREWDLDLTRCYVVGDAGAWDMVLARSVGARAVLVRTGLGEGSLGEYRHLWAGIEPDFVAADVLEAVQWILTNGGVPWPISA